MPPFSRLGTSVARSGSSSTVPALYFTNPSRTLMLTRVVASAPACPGSKPSMSVSVPTINVPLPAPCFKDGATAGAALAVETVPAATAAAIGRESPKPVRRRMSSRRFRCPSIMICANLSCDTEYPLHRSTIDSTESAFTPSLMRLITGMPAAGCWFMVRS